MAAAMTTERSSSISTRNTRAGPSLTSPVIPANINTTRKRPDRNNSSTAAIPSPLDSRQINRPPLSRTQTQTTTGIFTPRVPTTANASPSREPIDETARTNALWAEMRATLAEVELAATKGTAQNQFFGPAHAAALEGLRNAQIGLAQAWARADGDSADHDGREDAERSGSSGDNISPGGSVVEDSGAAEGNKSRVRSSSGASSASAGFDTSSLAAEKDIATARARREANDRYFYRVSKGVVDVVGKLDEVARAMARVEKESRSVWSDEDDSDDTDGDSQVVKADSVDESKTEKEDTKTN